MTTKVRCAKCRGQKEYAGIGAIMKPCEPCGATGLVEQIKLKPVEKIDISSERVEKEEENVHIPEGTTEVCSLEDIFPGVSKAMEEATTKMAEVITKDLSESSEDFPKPTVTVKKKEPEIKQPIFNGYSDAMMEALIAESLMDSEEWKRKYPHVAGMGVRERQSIMAMYAQSKPTAPRQVDLGKAQDGAVKGDPEYAAFQAKEKQLLAKQAEDNKKKGETKKKSSVGGV